MIRSLILPALALAPLAAADWGIDPVHSSAVFRVQHMGAGYTVGRFDQVSGSVSHDPAADGPSAVTFTAQAASVSTGNTKRDDHLRSPDFFDAKQFPTLEFASSEWKKTGDGTFDVTGKLTIHGVSKEITVKAVRSIGKNVMNQKDLLGFEVEFAIKRSDFGMKTMVGPVGDEVRISIEVEAEKK